MLRTGIVPIDYPEPVAADWPDLLRIVKERVKPSRDTDNRENYARLWWQFAERRPGMLNALNGKSRILVQCRISTWLSFVITETGKVFDISLNVFPLEGPLQGFAILQSRLHEVWARFMASSMKDDLRYTPSDCFETFPFPVGYESNSTLEEAGKAYYEFRADLMIRNNEGLTKTYNRFHDPNVDSADVQHLRELHAGMDRAVLDAYGWRDIQPVCAFFPEFDEEDEEDENGRPKKKRFRFRWPEEIHDEVLARLLELNRQRALEEGQILVPANSPDGPSENTSRRTAKKSTRKSKAADSPGPLFVETEEEA